MSPQSLQEESLRCALLAYSRKAARAILAGDALPADAPVIPGRFGGAFATFRRGALLRGCVGAFRPTSNLCKLLAETIGATLTDPRFVSEPITLEELEHLHLEISVLSDAMPVADPLRVIEPGRHGVWIRRGGTSGCFLPHVARERGWGVEEFLSNCCVMKAGLPADAWRAADTEVLVFTTEVISEL